VCWLGRPRETVAVSRGVAVVVIVVVAALGACEEERPKRICGRPWRCTVDAYPFDTVPAGCNPLTQAGCRAGEKCTWLLDALMPLYAGHVGCVPDGTAGAGDACAFGAPGDTGYDNCAKGLVCGDHRGGVGICKRICDPQGGVPECGAMHVCVTSADLFKQSTVMPVAGVCEVACDPLADNDFDGAGSSFEKAGTSCGSDAEVGCYGMPSEGTPPHTAWYCATDVHAASADPLGFRHRVPCTVDNGCASPRLDVTSCNQGYLPLVHEMTGSSTVVCVAICKPLDCYAGNCGPNNENRLGAAPHRCTSTDRVGTFITTQGGEHCQYLWVRERDDIGTLLRSPTSDSVGFCIDHSKYHYDADGDGQPETPLPPCATLPDGFGAGSALGAADLGCVDSTRAQAARVAPASRGRAIDVRGLYRR
jgi:hypothetical protein